MKKKLFDTTFGKLTVAYVFLGVIPLLLLSVLFFPDLQTLSERQ